MSNMESIATILGRDILAAIDPFRESRKKPPYGENLDLFLANRRIEEGVPIFYQQNVFYFYNVYELSTFLLSLPVYRRQRLRSLAFSYLPNDRDLAPRVFHDLTFLPRLLDVCIDIPEDAWMDVQRRGGQATNPLKIRNLDALAKSIHGLENVTFSKRCSRTADYLRAKMEEPARQALKRTEGALTDRQSRARAAKSKKPQY